MEGDKEIGQPHLSLPQPTLDETGFVSLKLAPKCQFLIVLTQAGESPSWDLRHKHFSGIPAGQLPSPSLP